MLAAAAISTLLDPYINENKSVVGMSEVIHWPSVYDRLATYLELLLKWNTRMNLTAIRDPEEIVCRHFGESLFAGAFVGDAKTLLDFGSGAGFPGVPIQILRPDVRVTLAESQGKKAAFLREVVRVLELEANIWASRVEAMPAERRFDVVAMRAVDRLQMALREGAARATTQMLVLGSVSVEAASLLSLDFSKSRRTPIPKSPGFLEVLCKS